MKQLSGTGKTFMLQGSGQQLLDFSTLIQNPQLFQELPLRRGSSFLTSSLAAGLSCAGGKPTPCPAPACSGLPGLMQKRGCQQQAVLQAHEEGAGSRLLPHIPFEFAAFEPLLPHCPIPAALLGGRAEIASQSEPVLGCQSKE